MHVSSIFKPIVGCLLLRGKLCPKCSPGAQKSVYYEKCLLQKCLLYEGFSMGVWLLFRQFLKKVSAASRCPLYSTSAIDRFDCTQCLLSNFVECESFLKSSSPDILALCETNLDDSTDSGNFSVRGYLPLIRKDSGTHLHGLAVYVKEGLPFAWYLSLENSADSY